METTISSVITHGLSEADIRTKYVTPAVVRAGWDPITQLREEYRLTASRVMVRGKIARRSPPPIRLLFPLRRARLPAP